MRDALRHALSWTHYRRLLRVDDPAARQWYVDEAVAQNWSSRALERQIGSQIASLTQSPREFVRDPVLLEFLGLPGTGRLLESDLEQGLMDQLQGFLLELGKGFALVAR